MLEVRRRSHSRTHLNAWAVPSHACDFRLSIQDSEGPAERHVSTSRAFLNPAAGLSLALRRECLRFL